MDTPTILMMSLLALAFYFVMLRPAQRERQERERFLAGLSRDDEVITTGGIHGRVAMVSEEQVTLLVADKSRIVFDKQAIERRAGDPVSQS